MHIFSKHRRHLWHIGGNSVLFGSMPSVPSPAAGKARLSKADTSAMSKQGTHSIPRRHCFAHFTGAYGCVHGIQACAYMHIPQARPLHRNGRALSTLSAKLTAATFMSYTHIQTALSHTCRCSKQLYTVRKAASSSLRSVGREIMIMTTECPFDLSTAILMHPTRGPSIPMTEKEMHTAFLARLQEIEQDETFDIKMTEVKMLASLYVCTTLLV